MKNSGIAWGLTALCWALTLGLTSCTNSTTSKKSDDSNRENAGWTAGLTPRQIIHAMPLRIEEMPSGSTASASGLRVAHLLEGAQAPASATAAVHVSWAIPSGSGLEPQTWHIYERTNDGPWQPVSANIAQTEETQNNVTLDVFGFNHTFDATTGRIKTIKLEMIDHNNQAYESIVSYVLYSNTEPLQITMSEKSSAGAPSSVSATYGANVVPLWAKAKPRERNLPETLSIDPVAEPFASLILAIETDFTDWGYTPALVGRASNTSYCRVEAVAPPNDSVAARIKYSFEDLPLSQLIAEPKGFFDYDDVVLYVDVLNGDSGDDTCDGIDDDSDGQVDEDYVAPETSCGEGACAATGLLACVAGTPTDTCVPLPASFSDATCNNIDDDCDGSVDEDYAESATSCGIGACASAGTLTCVNGVETNSCMPSAPAATDATCDGIDDDCDNAIDEDYVGALVSCGDGACAAVGTMVCENGVEIAACSPLDGAANDAVCNGTDDDCDGSVDEDYQPNCQGTQVATCVGGAVAFADCDDGNACNGQESCADAACVAGTAPTVDDGNPCTVDSCDAVLGVVNTPVADGTACGVDMVCTAGSCVQGNQPPVITSIPVDEAHIETVANTDAVDLHAWEVVSVYPGSQSNANWVIAADNLSVTQIINADASILLSDFVMTNDVIQGSWLVDSTSDDDLMGFVFGYQDTGHFYLFDWKQADQDVSSRGMSVKIVDTNDDLESMDFWPTVGSPGKVETIYHNDIPYSDRTAYDFTLEFHPDYFIITVTQQGSVVSEITLEHDRYSTGQFGFYNYSQERVVYQNFERTDLSLGSYYYDVEAMDPDGDEVSFDLLDSPEGMVINPETGEISWSPTDEDAGIHSVSIEAMDEHGATDVQTFDLTVVANDAPEIISIPETSGMVDELYLYDVDATDPDGDALSYSLSEAPAGMVIDETTGEITWTPTVDDLGSHDVSVTATDTAGNAASQSFSIAVLLCNENDTRACESVCGAGVETCIGNAWQNCDAPLPETEICDGIDNDCDGAVDEGVCNHAPIVAEIPDVEMVAGDIQDVFFEVYDADGDELAITVDGMPAFGIIEPVAGMPNWTALTFSPDVYTSGAWPMAVTVSDGALSVTEEFVLTVLPRTSAPVIISTPVTSGAQGALYSYDVDATDADGDTLAYSLTVAPTGMSIDAVTGLIAWTPAASQVGDNDVEVMVDDGEGGVDSQTFVVTVAPWVNSAPVIDSTPVTSAVGGGDYTYQVVASDVDGDTLTYVLDVAPDGMSITEDGFISWPDDGARIFPADVTVVVSDGNGGEASQSFTIDETEVAPPAVTVALSLDMIDVGETVTVQVNATSDVSITGLQAFIDGASIALDAAGAGEVTPSEAGFYTIYGSATDELGQSGSAERELKVGNPGDTTYPQVSLQNQNCLEATDLTPIVGTATDVDGIHYELRLRSKGAANWVVFTEGYTDVVNGELGIFDATVLKNGVYDMQLYATDTSGNVSTVTSCAVVDSGLKVGQVNFATVDVQLPVIGPALSLVREYDSRNTEDGDFGPGWNLAHKNVSAQAPNPLGEGWGVSMSGSIIPIAVLQELYQHFLVIRLSDTEIYRFRMVLSPASAPYELQWMTVSYQPQDGTQGQLVALGVDDEVILNGDRLMTYDADQYDPTRFRLTTRDGTVYVIGPNGVESVTDQYGNSVTYANDGITHSSGVSISIDRGVGNRIEHVADGFGGEYDYYYDEDGMLERVVQTQTNQAQNISRILSQYGYDQAIIGESLAPKLESIVAPDGTELGQFEYDSAGRVTALIDADGNRVIYGYDVPNHTQTVTDRLDNVTTYNYDAQGNVTRKVDALGNESTWTYDGDGNMLSETDPEGNTRTYTYNSAGEKLTETDALGNTTSYTYNSAGLILTRTDALGRVHTTERDANGNPIREIDPVGNETDSTYDDNGLLLTQTNDAGIVSGFTYDAAGQVIETVTYRADEPGVLLSRSETEYDNAGRPVRSVQYVNVGTADETVIETTSEYDAFGNLVAQSSPSGTTTFEYNVNGKKTASTDVLGNRTEYIYDANGNLITTVLPDGDSDPFNNPTTSSVYDAEGRVVASTDMFGNTTTNTYNAVGQKVATTYPDGSSSNSVYDRAGRLVESVDRMGGATLFEYDPTGNQVRQIDALGNVSETEYDAVGNRVRTIDALDRETEFTYDALDRLVLTTYPDGSASSRTYDEAGNVSSETDPAGRTTWMAYNDLGQLVEVRQLHDALTNDEAVTTFGYDASGRKVSQTDALGRNTMWEYNALGQMVARILPGGQSETFTYSADGRQESHTRFDGVTTLLDYDSMGRLLNKTWLDGINDAVPDVTYDYDAFGRIESAEKDGVQVIYAYDNSTGRLASLAYPGIGRIDYEYDALGRRTALTTITGQSGSETARRVEYGYDALSRLSFVGGAHGTTGYDYSAVGALVAVATTKDGQTTLTEYSRNMRDQVVGMVTTAPDNTVLASRTYTLDASGMVWAITEPGGRQTTYTYDSMSRMTSETINPGGDQDTYTWQFAYDKVGNRIQQERPDGEVIAYSYDNNDRLVEAVSSVNGSTTYAYNANGELISEVGADKTATYEYDPEGRMVAANVVTLEGPLSAVYTYDPNNNRVGSQVTRDGVTDDVSYLVDPAFQFAQVLAELDENGDSVAEYTVGNDLIAQTRDGLDSYYQYDRLGSVRLLTEADGTILNRYTYEAYGNDFYTTESEPNTFKFTGEQEMPELGQYYLRARMYDPMIGRFGSVDPFSGVMTSPLTLNKYGYTEGRPTTYVDPGGEFSLVDVSISLVIREITATQCMAYYYGKQVQVIGDGLWNIGMKFVADYFSYRGVRTYTLNALGLKGIPNVMDFVKMPPGDFFMLDYAFKNALKFGVTGLILSKVGAFAASRLKIGKYLKVDIPTLKSRWAKLALWLTNVYLKKKKGLYISPSKMFDHMIWIGDILDDYRAVLQPVQDKIDSYSFAMMAADYYLLMKYRLK